jgi:phosphinothricin acetyltransferase
MIIAPCTRTQAPAILAIFNDAIVNTTALYEYEPRTLDFMTTWFDTKEHTQLPVLGAFTEDGTLTGFATYGVFRTLPAYHHTVEHSVYVHPNHRGRGVARTLLGELIAAAQSQDYHVLIGVIDSANIASIALHRAFGFVRTGTLHEVGFKFGRWLDVDLYQLTLPTPTRPREK